MSENTAKEVQQEIENKASQFIDLAKGAGRKAYYVGVGAISKAEETAQGLYSEYAEAGAQELGEKAEGKAKPVLASRGFVAALKDLQETLPSKRQALYERCVEAGRIEKGETASETSEFVLAAIGASLLIKQEGEKFVNELITAGEKRNA